MESRATHLPKKSRSQGRRFAVWSSGLFEWSLGHLVDSQEGCWCVAGGEGRKQQHEYTCSCRHPVADSCTGAEQHGYHARVSAEQQTIPRRGRMRSQNTHVESPRENRHKSNDIGLRHPGNQAQRYSVHEQTLIRKKPQTATLINADGDCPRQQQLRRYMWIEARTLVRVRTLDKSRLDTVRQIARETESTTGHDRSIEAQRYRGVSTENRASLENQRTANR